MVPSLINPPTVLDLAAGNSLVDALAGAGLRPLLVDWGATDPGGLETMITERLVPLVEQLPGPVALAGYCLGGTMALAAAARLGTRVSRLALLATPWHFSAYGEARTGLAGWWQGAEPAASALGAVPMDLLQPAFWALDSDGLAAKYARFADLPDGPEATAFTTLEDWSNTGQPLSLAAARDLAETLFRDDASGRGQWQIGGQPVDPAGLDMPILDIIAGRDRIVPPAAALTTAGPGTALHLDAGHVGMVVGGRAPELLWRPLAGWLKGAE
jgi:polyhydroxyalkanoate synthase subunit PhaC